MNIDEKWQSIAVRKLSPGDLSVLLDTGDYYVLDVRPLDYGSKASFIRNAVLCPLIHLSDRRAEIPKDSRIIITDWAMKQAPVAAKFLISKGYNVIGVLKGGIERWKHEGLPVKQRESADEINFPPFLIKQ